MTITRRCVLAAAALITFLVPTLLNADEGVPTGRDPFADWDMPDFMKHWEFGIDVEDEKAPHFFADIYLPLYESAKGSRTIFLEPRVVHFDGETLLNTGVGYRQLVNHNRWILGANLFYDYETEHAHDRIGPGVEALSAFAEFRANGYFGLSKARTVDPGITANVIEKVVDGFDLEVGAPVPYYSRLKVFGGYEWYDFKQFENREGWSTRAEYTPFRFIVIDVTLKDNNKRTTGWGVTVAFRPPFGENLSTPDRPHRPLFKLDDRIFPDSNVEDRMTRLVERHHDIVVERYQQLPGQVNIEIRRGT